MVVEVSVIMLCVGDGEVGDHVECLCNVDAGDAGDHDVDAAVDGAEVCKLT